QHGDHSLSARRAPPGVGCKADPPDGRPHPRGGGKSAPTQRMTHSVSHPETHSFSGSDPLGRLFRHLRKLSDGPASMAAMIVAEGLTKYYGEQRAVDELSFTVQPGVVTGFLGPNGSGKS